VQALITGAGGFVGGHLLAYLHQNTNLELHGTLIGAAEDRPALQALCERHVVDLRDPDAVRSLLETIKPLRIYHLAGQAYVPQSFEDPWGTLESNIRGTLNLLQAVRDLKLDTRLLVIGSAEIYGAVRPEALPITEDTPPAPSSPYSVSKVAQDLLALQYFLSYRIFTVRMRPFNHIGPGQNNRFAVSSFAQQIAQIELGMREPVVEVGNLSAERDLSDVRDVVRAYHLSLESGEPGAVYNVCSGTAHSMRDVLDRLIAQSTHTIEVRIAADRLRPVEIPRLVGDFSRLHRQTGWAPQISLDDTLRDVLADWRERLRTTQTS
jgi:GDP-4-dehydro-6-deoxy-D-mannose reductase